MFHRETDAKKVARNRDAIFDLHAAALAWLEDYTGIPYQFGKFDFVLDPVVPVRRHGAPRRDLLQRRLDAARRIGHREPDAEPRQHDRARDRAHVVRRPRHDALVRRCVDEGGVRELHGGEDREPVVPEGQSRAALPGVELPGRVRAWIGPQAPIRSASSSTTSTRPAACTAPIIYQKAPIVMRQLERLIGEAPAARRPARLSEALSVRQRDLARSGAPARRAHAIATWRRGATPGSKRPGGRRSEPSSIRTPPGSVRRLRSCSATRSRAGRCAGPKQMEVLVGTAARTRSFPVELSGERVDVPLERTAHAACGPRSCCRPAVGWLRRLRARRRRAAPTSSRTSRAERSGCARRRLGHALGRDARRPHCAGDLVDAVLRALPRRETPSRTCSSWPATSSDLVLAISSAGLAAPRWRRASSRCCRTGLTQASSSSVKSTYFSAFRSMVTTPDGVAFLERVWRRAGKDSRAGAGRTRRGDAWRSSWRCAAVPTAAAILDEQRGAIYESRSPGPLRIRDAGAFRGSSRTRDGFFAGLSDVSEPPARAVGDSKD